MYKRFLADGRIKSMQIIEPWELDIIDVTLSYLTEYIFHLSEKSYQYYTRRNLIYNRLREFYTHI